MPGPVKKPTRVGKVNRSARKRLTKSRKAIKDVKHKDIVKWAESPEGKRALNKIIKEKNKVLEAFDKAHPKTPEEWRKYLRDMRTPTTPIQDIEYLSRPPPVKPEAKSGTIGKVNKAVLMEKLKNRKPVPKDKRLTKEKIEEIKFKRWLDRSEISKQIYKEVIEHDAAMREFIKAQRSPENWRDRIIRGKKKKK